MTGLPEGPGAKSTTGLNSNLVAAFAYLGGALTGILVLIIEKDSRIVRFHAMQSTITFLGVLVLHLILTAIPIIGWVLYAPFLVAVVILWVFLIVQALKGHEYNLPYIGDLAERQLGKSA